MIGNVSRAQFGEDLGVLSYLGTKGTFAEVGAFMPECLSQTFLLEQHGWNGVLIEPQPDNAAQLRLKRTAQVFELACGSPEQAGRYAQFLVDGPLSRMVSELQSAVKPSDDLIEVFVQTLDAVLTTAAVSRVDFLSIDTEGSELDVLRGFDVRRWKPKLIIIEDHEATWDKHRYLVAQGFRFVKRTGCNNWFVPQDSTFPTSFWEQVRFKARMARTWVREVSRKAPTRRGPQCASSCCCTSHE